MDSLSVALLVVFGLIATLIVAFSIINKKNTENYEVAKDEPSTEMFEKLLADLTKLYPHDLSIIDMKGLVSCVPEDSFTENKRHVSICLRSKKGEFYPYGKLLKIGIHELAHVMSKQHDPEHKTEEFINNYGSLMKKARELGYKVE